LEPPTAAELVRVEAARMTIAKNGKIDFFMMYVSYERSSSH
jgi:hypothetical protein